MSAREVRPRSARLPSSCEVPAIVAPRSLSRKGTPASGAAGGPDRSSAAASSRAASNRVQTTALRWGLTRSIRSIAASTSSSEVSCRSRTSAACASASIIARSSRRVIDTSVMADGRPTGTGSGRVGCARPQARSVGTEPDASSARSRLASAAAQSGGSAWYINSVWMPALRFRNAWMTYQTIPTMNTRITKATPELFRYAATPWPWMPDQIGPTPANQ